MTLPKTMRAARLHAYRKPLQFDEIPVPRPAALAFEPLDRINHVHDQLEAGKAEGRLVLTP